MLDDFTISLVDVADRAQDLMDARDRFDDFCHNYRRQSERYVEQRQKWDTRSPEQIQEEFPRIFAENVKLVRARVRAARNSYISAHHRARDAGIPRRCLRYVESVDVDSEDSLELLEDEASNMRRRPRTRHRAGPYREGMAAELYHPRDRVADWRNGVAPDAPLSDDELDYDAIPAVEEDDASEQAGMSPQSVAGEEKRHGPDSSRIKAKSAGPKTRPHTPSETQQRSSGRIQEIKLKSLRFRSQGRGAQKRAAPKDSYEEDFGTCSPVPKRLRLTPRQFSRRISASIPTSETNGIGQAADPSAGLAARIIESTDQELQRTAEAHRSVRLSGPGANTQRSNTTPARPVGNQGSKMEKVSGAERIAEVRQMLAQQRRGRPRK